MKFKKLLSSLLAGMMLVSIIPPITTFASEQGMEAEEADLVWLTEIYNNDIARNDIYNGLSGPTIDSMDYIEVYNASASELDFGTNYHLIYNDGSDKTFTFVESEIKIPAQSAAVFWVRRVDLENKGKLMPDETDFRESLNVPEDVPVFSVNNQTALKNSNASIKIANKSNNKIVSQYNYDRSDVGEEEGTSVHLQAVEGIPNASAIAKQADPSAGIVMDAQKYALSKAILTVGNIVRSSENEAVVSFISSKTGKYYYEAVDAGEAAPTIDTNGSGNPINENTDIEIILEGLTAGAKDLYVVVKNKADVVSDPLKIEIPDFISDYKLYLTEIYPNDIPRNGIYNGLSSSTVDSMDYIEVYNASPFEIDFGSNFQLVYTDTSVSPIVDKVLTFNESKIKIPAETAAIFWVRRVDLENKGKLMPNETDFRESLNIPIDVPIFSVNNQAALRNTTSTVAIVAKNSNEVISTFSYVAADAGSKEGSSVHLRAAEGVSQTVAISKQAAPTAGQLSDVQKTLIENHGIVPELSILENEDGKYNNVVEGTDLSIPYSYKDASGTTSFVVYYRTNKSLEWTEQSSTSFNTRTPGKYYVEIGADRFLNSEYIEYYVKASNLFYSTTTDIHRVNVIDSNTFTGIRPNLSQNETVSGVVTVTGRAEDNDNVEIKINGNSMDSSRIIERGVYFTLDISGLDGRKNAILVNEQVVQIFSRWYSVLPSRAVPVDSHFITFNQNGDTEVTVKLVAGTEIDHLDTTPGTASDNFNVTNFALVLRDGTIVYPDGDVKSTDNITMNSSRRVLELHFTIPANALNANSTEWDTSLVSDGAYTISFTSENYSKDIQVNVDNTGPAIHAEVPDHIDGVFTFTPAYQDASVVLEDTLSLELDGKVLTGTTFNGSELSPGEHTLKASVQDEHGNIGIKSWEFTSSVNYPVISQVVSTAVEDEAALLTASLSSGTDAIVSFHEAATLTIGKGITVYQGTGDHTADAEEGLLGTVTSQNGYLPYQIYEFDVNNDEFLLRLSLEASTDYGKDVRLYVSNKQKDKWLLLPSDFEEGKITTVFETEDYIIDGKIYVLAQGREIEMSPSQKVGRTSTEANDYVWDGTGEPEQYDFSIAWLSDTQYYTERFPDNFRIMNEYIVENKDRMNIRYVVHTGDLIDDIDETYQWEYADQYMRIFEDAELPYGVLAGNHDIAQHNRIYQNYQKYFGEERFKNNGVYGESYINNIGHYDLITAGGQDFIFVYMSFDFDREAAVWMNRVLAEHSDRIAIINLHNYVNKEGELDTAGQFFKEEVVAKNPNVRLVLGGHYHGAAINITGFDDDNDGTEERTVYQILSDYQSDAEGGSAYYKTLYFDLANGKIYMNAYSPKYNDFNYFDKAKLDSYGIGVKEAGLDIYELDLDFNVASKSLTVNSIDAVVISNTALDHVIVEEGVASVTVDNSAISKAEWIAIAKNGAGATYSETAEFNIELDTAAPELKSGTATRTGNSSATVTFTADEKGVYYYEVVNDGATAPTIDTIGTGIAYQANALVSIKLENLSTGAKDIYIVAKDKAGNVSNVLKIDIPAYITNTVIDNSPLGEQVKIENRIAGNVNTLSLDLDVSTSAGIVTANITSAAVSQLQEAIREAEKAGKIVVVELVVNIVGEAATADITVPQQLLSMLAQMSNAELKINTKASILTLDEQAMKAIQLSSMNASSIKLTIAKEKVNENGAVSFDLSIHVGQTKLADLGSGKALISISYPLMSNENPNAIVTYIKNDKGDIQYVRTKYNGSSKSVEFTTNQFTKFSVAYNLVTFIDVDSSAWYYDAVTFNAARDITTGTGNDEFSPNAPLTRGQFLAMLMRAYGITVDQTLTDNFSDAGNTYYSSYLATAKKLGITNGIGNNTFAPENQITREDMFTLIYRVLDVLNQLPQSTGDKSISDFADNEHIAGYANHAVDALIKAGIINGSNGKLNPGAYSTRAELAQLLFNLLTW